MRPAAALLLLLASFASSSQDKCADDASFKTKRGSHPAASCSKIGKMNSKAREKYCTYPDASGRLAAQACPRTCDACAFVGFSAGATKINAGEAAADPRAPRVELLGGKNLAKEAALFPVVRSVLLVDVADATVFRSPHHDALHVAYDAAAAEALWRAGAASVLLDGATAALPLAELAVDMVVVDLGTPRVRAMTDEETIQLLVECARVLAGDGVLVAIRPGDAAALVDAQLASKALGADLCAAPGAPTVCGKVSHNKRCVPLSAVLRRDGRFSNVFRRVHDAKAVTGACCVADPKRCPKCPRFTRASSSYPTIADANRAGAVAAAPSTSLGRLAFWDVDAMLKNYGPAVWGRKYAERNPQAWRRNYVGVAGVLPEKREWLPSFTKDIKDGHIRTVLDAGAGTCSLDAHLRRHRARERVRLVSFGFYDCSMARVCGERGSLILDWSWLDPLPFCAKCTFDLVFQAEGMHHTAPDALPAERDRVCGPSRRLGTTRGPDDGSVDGRRLAAADGATRRAGNVAAGNRTADARRALRGRKRGGSWASGKNSKTEKHVSRASHSGLACAQKLWQAAFDHLGAAVACGGVLYVTDLLGDVYDGKAKDGPRCWSEFGARWAKANGYATVRAMSGAPCTQHYPALHVKKTTC